jgi:hypothetical protein
MGRDGASYQPLAQQLDDHLCDEVPVQLEPGDRKLQLRKYLVIFVVFGSALLNGILISRELSHNNYQNAIPYCLATD